ncbi:MAG TPA: hypothetical protein VJV05_07535 [Pyrinomonadaceae bacterium]|nr:hypothetical protein [Pyrinomonadaceae bacterium]
MRLVTALMMSMLACQVGETRMANEPVPTGVWGGKGIQLTVTEEGGLIDYGCDSGTIDQRLQTDSHGKFSAKGAHIFGRGGPRRPGDAASKPRDAQYEGVRKEDELEITVRLPELDRNVGTFTVRLGQSPTLERCG